MGQPFKKIESEEIYKGKIITVLRDTVEFENKQFKWEIVEQREAVVVIPYFENDKFILINQFRYTVGNYIWEFPAGRIEPGEEILFAAQRELEEECGYSATNFSPLISYYPSPGVSTEIMHLVLATDLTPSTNGIPDYDEIIEPSIKSSGEIETMLTNGDIRDAKTILGYLYFKAHFRAKP